MKKKQCIRLRAKKQQTKSNTRRTGHHWPILTKVCWYFFGGIISETRVSDRNELISSPSTAFARKVLGSQSSSGRHSSRWMKTLRRFQWEAKPNPSDALEASSGWVSRKTTRATPSKKTLSSPVVASCHLLFCSLQWSWHRGQPLSHQEHWAEKSTPQASRLPLTLLSVPKRELGLL